MTELSIKNHFGLRTLSAITNLWLWFMAMAIPFQEKQFINESMNHHSLCDYQPDNLLTWIWKILNI